MSKTPAKKKNPPKANPAKGSRPAKKEPQPTEENRAQAAKYAAKQLLAGNTSLAKIKQEAARKFNLPNFLRNSEILPQLPKSAPKRVRALLLKRPSRTASGVTPVALMIKPEGSCPFSCIYCPYTGKAAKSYTGEEPAALRARQFGFDALAQVQGRLRHYAETGHPTDKCEAIIMGGTFLSMPEKYKRAFVKKMYDGFNNKPSRSIANAKKINESAKCRVVGLTMETRPDVCKKAHIREMLSYGATRVELGVQNPDDIIYKKINRGHSVKDVENATKWLRDSAFKVCYHLMPGLPGSGPKKDVQMVKRVFLDSRFMPDMLKVYPTLVLGGTILSEMAAQGKYEPYSTEEAADVISEFYRHIPKWARVMRIQRDIPSGLIGAGVEKSNLRELVEAAVRRKGIDAKEIRYREPGVRKLPTEKPELCRTDYLAAGGREIFLSIEAGNCILGFARLRIPHSPFVEEIPKSSALIRELHVYGPETSIGRKGESAQHRSFGSALLKEAEYIAKEECGKAEMVIISGVGARRYYYKHGYAPKGPYVAKKL
ncbi:tRNA uridine(34) 5-carboxymethylaminomethyl modification radical SAM/GNAT enzyme Elp3 [Candidatus Micrarchaeota archaeon]|nr:tRNA uridine(34) 5-carboxymethylaminomethyl modification radical SAM/GNAT enzyme Elp3 [Candidatus Micrarchaeota archaeon]